MNRILLPGIALVLIAVGGCGGKIKPMTSAQTDHFKATLSSLGSVATSVSAVKPDKKFPSRALSLAMDAMAADSSLSAKNEKIKQLMSDATASNECTPSGTGGSPGSVGGMPAAGSFLVRGEKCPIQFSFSMAATSTSSTEAKMEVVLEFTIQDPELRKLIDIDSIKVRGSFKIAKANDNEMVQDFSVEGTLHSQKEGNLDIYLKGNGRMAIVAMDKQLSQSMELAFGIKFPDFTGELMMKQSVDGSGNPATEYFVNGEKVTQAEFNKYGTDIIGNPK